MKHEKAEAHFTNNTEEKFIQKAEYRQKISSELYTNLSIYISYNGLYFVSGFIKLIFFSKLGICISSKL